MSIEFGYPEVGKLRLGRVLIASLKMQKLNYRSTEELTKRLYYKNLAKGTITSYKNGHLSEYKQYTLQKVAFLCFKVAYFITTDEDPVGNIVFANGCRAMFDKHGEIIKGSYSVMGEEHLEKLKTVTDVKDLPLYDERYHRHQDLESILNCETEAKSFRTSTVVQSGAEVVR